MGLQQEDGTKYKKCLYAQYMCRKGVFMKNETIHDANYVPLSGKFGYWCGAMSYVFSMAVPVFLIYYATEQLAIAIGAVSIMMMLVKIWDGITDFIAGIIIDRTKSRKGKARPWFLRVAVPYGISLALTFSIPAGWGTTAKLAALAVMYALTVSVFGTVVGVAKYALIPRMTRDVKQRSTLGMIGDGSAVVFSGILMTVTFSLVASKGYTLIFAIYGVVACITCFLCYIFTREQTEEITEMLDEKRKQKGSVKDLLRTLIRNKYALLLFLYVTILYIGCGMIQTGGTYYATYVYGDYSLYSRFMLAGTIGSVVAIFIGTPLVRRLGSKAVFAFGCILAAVSYLAIIFTDSRNPLVIIVSFFFIIMFSQVFTNTQTPVMIAAAADYGEWKNGEKTEGITSGVADIGTKIGQALAAGIFGLIMAAGGFVEGGVEQTASAIQSIKVGFIYVVPTVFLILGIIYILTYKLEKQHPQILKELEERGNAHQK